mgnify:CR=1 FL=1
MSDTIINSKTQQLVVMEQSISQILECLGYNTQSEHLQGTPLRVVKALQFLTSGHQIDIKSLFTLFDNKEDEDEDLVKYNGMVVLRDIDFYSLCSHHLLPFYGKAHIAYIADEKIVGISKLARVVDVFSKRLQIQERLTEQIAQFLVDGLKPKGVMVVVEGIHLCMRMRGIQKQNSVMTTSAVKGIFSENSGARDEFLKLVFNGLLGKGG